MKLEVDEMADGSDQAFRVDIDLGYLLKGWCLVCNDPIMDNEKYIHRDGGLCCEKCRAAYKEENQ